MIILRRAGERRNEKGRGREAWLSFYPKDPSRDLLGGFGGLKSINEHRLGGAGRVGYRGCREAEVVTYVREGGLLHDDSNGRPCLIDAGEFQRLRVAGDLRYNQSNVSRSASAYVLQLWFHASPGGVGPCREQARFGVAERRGGLCVVASHEERGRSLRLAQDARVYSGIFDRGQHVVHEIRQGRRAWLHLVEGEVKLADFDLTTGDGAGLIGERALSFTAGSQTEVLLVDLAETSAPVVQPSDSLHAH